MKQGFCDEMFSTTAMRLRPSAVRELLKVIKQPDMISFAGGMPAPEVFPADEFARGAHLLTDRPADLLQYATTEGDNDLREEVIRFMEPRLGRKVNLSEVLITTGSQQALDLYSWAMFDEGDVIITEDPTYMAALNAFGNHGAKAVGVKCDGDGMLMDELEATIKRLQAEGKKVKTIYTIVNFQNPGGMTMSVERRKKLSEISDTYGIPVFEDDPYGFVRFEGEHLPSIYSFNKNNNVLYAGSFSKILAPGTRIGWVIGPENIIRKMTVFKQSTDLCSCSIAQAMVAEYCQKGYLEKHLPLICETYKQRRDVMDKAMEQYLKPLGCTWVKPQGGFFFWLNLGEGVNCEKVLEVCLKKKVAFVVGTAFCVNPETGRNYARINFTFCKPEKIEEGIKRLAEAIKEVRN